MMFFTLFLTKTHNDQINTLSSCFVNKQVVYDTDYNDTLIKTLGFFGLTKMIKSPCSWDKSFYFLHQNNHILDNFDYFFFIEDDVYSKNPQFLYNFCESLSIYNQDLITNEVCFKKDCPNWHWWSRDNDYYQFKYHIKSYNPLCRLSKNIVKKILEFRTANNRFIFHELLFSCIAVENEMTILDINTIPEKKYIGKFHWRPKLSHSTITDEKIYHPVKPIF